MSQLLQTIRLEHYTIHSVLACLVEGDATDMSFEDGTFDGLASIQTLEYIADIDRALAEARRVLKSGGNPLAESETQGNHVEPRKSKDFFNTLSQELT